MNRIITSTFCIALSTLAPACMALDADDLGSESYDVIVQPPQSGYICARDFLVYPNRGEATDDTLRRQPYCGTNSIQGSTVYPGYTRLVFVQHGRTPIAQDYFNIMTTAAQKAGVQAQTFIVAPQFMRQSDWNSYIDGWPWDFESQYDLHWLGSDWASGETSVQSNGALARSSFKVYDLMVSAALARLPDVQEVIFVGQSAGGQFIHRYAAVGTPTLPAGVTARYVSANAQSYLYLDETRPFPVPNTNVAPNNANCLNYDVYHVGLGSFDPADQQYMISVGENQIINQYKNRNMTYLVGALDTGDPEGGAYSCRMEVQGDHRLERGMAYANYIQNYFLQNFGINVNHRFQMVPNVSHGLGILDEDCAIRWIFNLPAFCN
jgi:hypothetical protein